MGSSPSSPTNSRFLRGCAALRTSREARLKLRFPALRYVLPRFAGKKLAYAVRWGFFYRGCRALWRFSLRRQIGSCRATARLFVAPLLVESLIAHHRKFLWDSVNQDRVPFFSFVTSRYRTTTYDVFAFPEENAVERRFFEKWSVFRIVSGQIAKIDGEVSEIRQKYTTERDLKKFLC